MYTDVVISDDSKTALLAYPGGKLRQISLPDMKVRQNYTLPNEPYRMVLDSKKGILYAMCTQFKGGQRGHFPRDLHGKGDLYCFDVSEILKGNIPANTNLPAKQTVPVGGRVATLLLSPDGNWVYFLDVDNDRIGRVNTATAQVQGTIQGLDPTTEAMCLTPNGQTLYAASHLGKFDYYNGGPYRGTVQKVDTATFKLVKSVKVNTHPIDVQATDDHLVFLSLGSGQHSSLTIVDMKTESQNNSWAGTFNANKLCLSPDQKHIFVSNWMTSPAGINAFAVPKTITGGAQQTGGVGLSANFGTRGEMRMSRDGQFLFCDAGRIILVER